LLRFAFGLVTDLVHNSDRPHMSLGGDSRVTRDVEPPTAGKVIALPRVGGLHHRYSSAA
jgi:putative transposase